MNFKLCAFTKQDMLAYFAYNIKHNLAKQYLYFKKTL